jgi:acyl carrier protein
MAEKEITARIAEALEVPPGQIRSSTKASEVAQWDSMGALALLVMLNRDFGLNLKPNESDALQSVQGIVGLLRARGVAA